ncbi:Hypothetical predicted protein [Mytilus galloprovincialis]|uniref:Uncharacterized protein n=1 Tax=Mytilus galloprovincialis TaxID=29158 RepID=A0A8B6FB71_MYTGA|nr:Hypothetical predicted protein [Mytilus galloprovincialis]
MKVVVKPKLKAQHNIMRNLVQKKNPTIYDDLINANSENKVYENDSKQWTLGN